MRKLVTLFVLVLLFSSVAAFAETAEEFDGRILQELQSIDPGAVPAWKAANAARDAGRFEEAAAKYAEVARRAPTFFHALRRQAGVELRMGKRDLALTHARQAITISRTPENVAVLADVIVNGDNLPPEQISEGLALAKEAAAMQPNGHYEHATLAVAAIVANDVDQLNRAVETMLRIDAKNPATHFYHHVALASAGKFDEAQQALDQARMTGLPEEAYVSMSRALADARPFYLRWWKPVAIAFALWAVAFAALLGVGAWLSKQAMHAAQDTPEHLAQNSTLLSDRIRALYAKVLTVTSVYYYLSIPVVMLLVVLVLGGIVYGFFALGWVPVKLAFILVAVMAISIWSMIKSLFIRVKDEDPGRKLDLAAQPKLRAVLDEVAQQIGTRAVDNVYLTPFTEVAVYERGKGNKERCLILGVAAVEALKVRPFKAILGHEYGHFTNRDTAGGAFAFSVRRSLGATAVALAQGGAATWYNPAWLFVNGFYRVFLRISEGASRLQEILADRWAVFAYGANAFEEGLRTIVAQSVRFDAHVDATIREVVDGKLALANLYTYRPATLQDGATLAENVEAAINAEASEYDSHPPAAQRFALVRALNAPEPPASPEDELPAWSLFANAEELQLSMTEQVRENVKMNTGIEIAAAPA